MFIPRNPWSFRRKYHAVCCGLSGFIYALGSNTVKDSMIERVKLDQKEKGGPTVGFLLYYSKFIWGTGIVIVLDSGFFCPKRNNLITKLWLICISLDQEEELFSKVHRWKLHQITF